MQPYTKATQVTVRRVLRQEVTVVTSQCVLSLSMDRAQNVIAFLFQTCNVPVRHIEAPDAMGAQRGR